MPPPLLSGLWMLPPLNPYGEVAVVLLTAALVAAIGQTLRQPLIISFLLSGILVGPSALGIVGQHHDIALLAEIGISLLLFVVGLRLDIRMIRTVGPVALATGLGQVLFTSAIGFGLCLAFGMAPLPAAYVAVALTFSSTIIIVKLLSDKKEIDSLHGRIAVGFLIVQDIMAILALIGLTAFGGGVGEGRSLIGEALWIASRGLALVGVVIFLTRRVLGWLLGYLSRSQELLVVFAIAWAVSLAAVAEMLGFSKEVGAFIAGVALAQTPQRDAIGARLVVLRDFLLLFFFIALGARLEIGALGGQAAPAAAFSLFVLVGNPLIVMAIMGVMGYRRRTGFLCGLTVAQISEFSLILAALGVSLGHIGPPAMNLITLVGLITIFASTYMILYAGPLYDRLARWLGLFERRNPTREGPAAGLPSVRARTLLAGYGSYGREIASHLHARGRAVLVVDFDPTALEAASAAGFETVYGDVTDPELLAQLPLAASEWAVCAIPDRRLALLLPGLLRQAGFAGRIALTAPAPADAEAQRRGRRPRARALPRRRRTGRRGPHRGRPHAAGAAELARRPPRGRPAVGLDPRRQAPARHPPAEPDGHIGPGRQPRRADPLQPRGQLHRVSRRSAGAAGRPGRRVAGRRPAQRPRARGCAGAGGELRHGRAGNPARLELGRPDAGRTGPAPRLGGYGDRHPTRGREPDQPRRRSDAAAGRPAGGRRLA